jgi:hypothetical protein
LGWIIKLRVIIVFSIREIIKLNSLEFEADKPATIFDEIKKALFLGKLKSDRKYIVIIKEI